MKYSLIAFGVKIEDIFEAEDRSELERLQQQFSSTDEIWRTSRKNVGHVKRPARVSFFVPTQEMY
jgi:hypothetical protein